MKRLLRRVRTLTLYVLLFHVVKTVCDVLLPNAHVANVIRGWLLGRFFRRCDGAVAIASGCTLHAVWNLEVGRGAYIAHRCWLNAAGGLTIGKGAILSPNVVVATTAHARANNRVQLHSSKLAPVNIGDGAWIASNSVITRGVTIGAGAVVGACSVVVKDVEANWFVGGNPATLIRSLSE